MNRSLLALTILAITIPASAQFNGPVPSSLPTPNHVATLTTDRALLFPQVHDISLSPGDLISIKLFGETDYNPTVRISSNGAVLLPLIGEVSLQGLTVTQAEQLIADKLIKAGMYRDPQVTLQVTEGPNSVVTIAGEAHGVIPVTGTRRLLDVIAAAGGLPPTASHVITINRPGVPEPIVIDLGNDPTHSELANIPVFAGDTVLVSRVGVVYMVGAFKTQGAIPLTSYSQITLTQATALSGGLTFEGKFSDTRLIRTIDGKRTVVKLDIDAVLAGKTADPLLQPNDIVYLPNSFIKSAISSGGLGAVLSAASLAVFAISDINRN